MPRSFRLVLAGGVMAVLVAAFAGFVPRGATLAAEDAKSDQAALEPVEPNLHLFMELLLEPAYERFKELMKEEPANAQAWKAARSYSLFLAESNNLILDRPIKGADAEGWNQITVETRQAAGELYLAVKERDYEIAKEQWVATLKKCNLCHERYHGGKPILEP